MSMLVKATSAPSARNKTARIVSVIYASVLVLLAVAQLFTFDELVKVMPALNLPLSDGFRYVLAPLIVAAEVFALPFLLTMTLSVAFRWLSMVCGWLVPALWAFISLWLIGVGDTTTNVGMLGTIIEVSAGAALVVSVVVGGLAVWSSWGLWPGDRGHKGA